MGKFVVGQLDKGHLSIDLMQLINTRMLIQANSGGGKSWLLRVIAERTAGKVQTVILDPEGEFATLREKFDFALVGHGGEMATDVRTAELLARKLAEIQVSAVIDLYELKLGDKRRFISLFLNSLLSVPRQMWHPMLVVLDEAHRFCPEKGEVESSASVINLMDAGRKRGFAGIIATQRLSKLHKDAAAEANNVIIGRTWLDLDQERAGDLLGMRKADRIVLRDVRPGEFFAFGPSLSANGVCRFKSDPVATTHPKAGERHKLTVPKASEAIREIVAQIGDLPEQAEEEQREVERLHKRVLQLERELNARPIQVQPKVKKVVERVEVPIFGESEIARLESVARGAIEAGPQMVAAGQQIVTAIQAATAAMSKASVALTRPAISMPASPATPSRKTPAVAASGGTLAKAERAILTVLAWYPHGKGLREVAVLAGYSWRGGGFNNAIGRCRSQGWLIGDKARLQITDAGLEALGMLEPLPIGSELVDYWMRQLPKAERAILGVLVQHYPHALDDETLAAEAGYKVGTGGYNNAKSRLRALELIEGRRELKASDILFIEA